MAGNKVTKISGKANRRATGNTGPRKDNEPSLCPEHPGQSDGDDSLDVLKSVLFVRDRIDQAARRLSLLLDVAFVDDPSSLEFYRSFYDGDFEEGVANVIFDVNYEVCALLAHCVGVFDDGRDHPLITSCDIPIISRRQRFFEDVRGFHWLVSYGFKMEFYCRHLFCHRHWAGRISVPALQGLRDELLDYRSALTFASRDVEKLLAENMGISEAE